MCPWVRLQVISGLELLLGEVVLLLEAVDSGIDDADGLLGDGGGGAGGHITNDVDHIEATDDLAENNVLAVQPASLGQQDVELGAVGVWSVVGHGNPSSRTVRQDELLIVEDVAEDALAAAAVAGGDISHLDHEVLHDAVDLGVLVVQRVGALLVALGNGHEVESGHGSGLSEHSDHETTFVILTRTI